MNFWNLMVKKDDIIIFLANKYYEFAKSCNPNNWKLSKMIDKFPDDEISNNLYIVLNAPSINKQNLLLLKGKPTMFVNRGFKHPMYKDISPNYHVFIDTKMLNGTWPLSWIDEILELSPKTKILMPVEWYNNSILATYRNKIHWMKFRLPFYNLGVSGACFSFGISHKFKHIYITGFDATYLGYEITKSAESHFYGNDSELENKTTKQFEVDLYMFSRHLRDLNRFANYCKKKRILITNLTKGGLLDMFIREDFESHLQK